MPIFPQLQGDLERFSPSAPAVDLRQPLQQLMSIFEQGRERKTTRMGAGRDRAIIQAILSGGEIEPFEAPPQATGLLAKIMETLSGGRVTAKDLPVSPTETLAVKGAIERRKSPFTKSKIQTTLGELESGGATSTFGEVIPFLDRTAAENHALRKLGPNWEAVAPAAKEIIDRKFPEAKPKEITLPTNIATTSQAIKHLMRKEKMTREEAIDWLRAKR